MKLAFNNLKNSFDNFNIYQKIASLVLLISVPVCIALGVSAISKSNISDSSSLISSIIAPSSKPRSSSQASSSSQEGPVKVTLKPSSVEEDLEVQIVDENGELIVGPEFKLTIKGKSNGYNKTWTVNDGFLKLTKLASGQYLVSIEPMDGYIMPEEAIECKVEKKVAYEKVDVSDIVKDDSEVDASKEDAGYNDTKPTTPPATVQDTVEYVASSSKVVEKEVEVITYKYKPILSRDGTIKNKDGSSSGLYPVYDSQGYLSGAYKLQPKAAAVNLLSVFSIRAHAYNPEILNILPLTDEGDQVTSSSSSENSVRSFSESVSQSSSQSSSVSQSSSSSTSSSSSSSSGSTSSGSSTSSSGSSSSSGSVSQPETEKVEVKLFDDAGNLINNDLSLEKIEIKDTKIEKVTVYYGWQTLSGSKYYFDKNGNKVTGTQVIQGITYYFDKDGKMGSRIGIDVSKYQGNIDWKAVKNAGIEFAIIRVGYRGYGTGVLVEDPYFRQNIRGATAAGIKVGVYVFSQAITTQEAVEEASMCIEAVKGYNLAYPIFFDTEYSTSNRTGRADGLSKSHRTTIAKAFCETVRNAGYKAGIYASKSWFYNQLDYSQISSYHIWVAHYASATDFAYRYDIWQYTGSGTCAGIGGAVDMNIGYTAY